ncbi:MAG: HD domain-containing protein [Clostridia bacterium]|nr:HD domain-containing protein [Clostridia bacterium]
MKKIDSILLPKLNGLLVAVLFLAIFFPLISSDLQPLEEIEPVETIFYKPLISPEDIRENGQWSSFDRLDATVMKRPENIQDLYGIKLVLKAPPGKLLFLPAVYGHNFKVFDGDFNLVYEMADASMVDNYDYRYNMAYIPFFDTVAYVVARTSDEIPYIGIRSDVGTLPLDVIVPTFDSRKSIALLFIILSVLLIVMSGSMQFADPNNFLRHTGYFIGVFGLWSMFDFFRHGFWIRETFKVLPLPILLVVYIIASNLMMPLFVKLNITLIGKSKHRVYLSYLYKFTWLVAGVGLFFEIERIFYWSDLMQTIYNGYFSLYDVTVAVGSLVLIIFAWLDYRRNGWQGVIYAIGLTGCLVTFTVSQTTKFVISHWGVLWLLISIIWATGIAFIKAQEANRIYLEQMEDMNSSIVSLNDDLEYTQRELLLRLGSVVDLRSKETSQHVHRVADITQFIALKLSYPLPEAKMIALASSLHDIGKVGIPDRILNNPGRLSSEEYEAMKDHATMGFEILNGSDNELMDYAAIIAWTHHERYDGKGYPNGLEGEDIPLIGAVVAAADVFDALLSKRIYKRAWTYEEVYDYFLAETGKHFHPKVAQAVIENFESIKLLLEGTYEIEDRTNLIMP